MLVSELERAGAITRDGELLKPAVGYSSRRSHSGLRATIQTTRLHRSRAAS